MQVKKIFVVFLIGSKLFAQHSNVSSVWKADNENGTYRNPIIHADYSDPDVIRVGDDYYLTSSSFNYVPGLPILHSKDLVNWTIIGHVFLKQPPYDHYHKVQHGGGVWAPSIRYHSGIFYIFYPDPDMGIYMVKAKNITGPWSEPLLIKKAKGWIDPCPFWDDNGKAYLINGMAASRSGIKSILILNQMAPDGTKLLNEGALVFDGHDQHPTVEGPKLYKHNGYYYILAPAGGVGQGWQIALRSKHIDGPYEVRKVLEKGKSQTNGPHQGGLVETQTGETWFIHFQDKDAYGRIVHLEPVKWEKGWPVIGIDPDGNGIGEPVDVFRKPDVGKTYPLQTPQESDEFNSNQIGLQWQWEANAGNNFAFPAGINYGFLRLFNVPLPDSVQNFWDVPNILTQKFPAPNFTAITKITFTPHTYDEETGLIITGIDYAYVSIKKTEKGLFVSQTRCYDAEHGKPEIKSNPIPVNTNALYFKVEVTNVPENDPDYQLFNTSENCKKGNAKCIFSFSQDGVKYIKVGEPFAARKGKWVGAKVGLFAIRRGVTYETGYSDVDWFRIEK